MYYIKPQWGDREFCFKKTNGDWSKSIHINKYGSMEYKVEIIEGLSNCIKVTKGSFKTYKEVINFIK